MAHSITLGALAVSALFLTLGCGGDQALRTDASASGIRAAEEVGAEQVPRASLHLQLAKEGLARATKLASAGENAKAASMLARSEADAELAVALSREDAEMTESKAAVERVRQLRKENKLLLE